MFKWDGSEVTDIISKSDIYEANYGKYKYWVIANQDITQQNITQQNTTQQNATCQNAACHSPEGRSEICMIRTSKTNIPCLIDEIKTIFNLPKIGTHWCKQGGKVRILIKCPKTPEGYIKEEISLSEIKNPTNLLKLQVQETFAYRELLGVTCSYNSNINIREGKNGPYPVSFYEPNMLVTDNKIIPFTVLEKWFDETSIDQVVKRLCQIDNINDLPTLLHTLRGKLDIIIDRVDKRNISFKFCIINRITERLQTTLVK